MLAEIHGMVMFCQGHRESVYFLVPLVVLSVMLVMIVHAALVVRKLSAETPVELNRCLAMRLPRLARGLGVMAGLFGLLITMDGIFTAFYSGGHRMPTIFEASVHPFPPVVFGLVPLVVGIVQYVVFDALVSRKLAEMLVVLPDQEGGAS